MGLGRASDRGAGTGLSVGLGRASDQGAGTGLGQAFDRGAQEKLKGQETQEGMEMQNKRHRTRY